MLLLSICQYSDPSATVSDNYDGDNAQNLVTVNNVNTAISELTLSHSILLIVKATLPMR